MIPDGVLQPHHARAFRKVPIEYDAARPSYSPEAVSWLVGNARTIVELGAGTGKLTASLVAYGTVLATEPLSEMLAVLRRNVPGASAVVSAAESIPVRTASADLVIAAQAFHWFDSTAALASAARVLRPGGYLSLVWNMRDDCEPWVAELSAILGRHEVLEAGWDAAFVDSPFGPLERARFTHVQTHDADSLVTLAASRSYLAVATDEQRERVLAEVRALATEHPDLAGRATFQLPYVAECFRARLP